MLWSALAAPPLAGEDFVIPSTMHLILDISTPALGHVTVSGKLSVSMTVAVTKLTAKSMEGTMTGIFQMGNSLADPYLKSFTLELNALKPATGNLGVARGLVMMNGGLRIFADVSRAHRTRLNATAAAAATSLTAISSALNWKAGDEIGIGTTDHYSSARADRRILQSNSSGAALTLTAGISKQRYGVLQYINDGGLSLTNGTLTPHPSWPAGKHPPRVLDERAMLVNLTSNVVFQCPDDDTWNIDKFGFHCMIMGGLDPGREVQISGLKIIRGGQRGLLGRYPIHWHMISYSSYSAADPVNSGKIVYGDADGHWIKHSIIDQSENRGFVIHGTNGILVEDCVGYSIRGHCFFLENGSERRNIFRRCVAMSMNDPHPGVARTSLQFNPDGSAAGGIRLAKHESIGGGGGPAGYWITNPDNIVTDCWANDSIALGFWFSFSHKIFGPSRNVQYPGLDEKLAPRYMDHGEFSKNIVIGCVIGAQTDQVVKDESGDFLSQFYEPKNTNRLGGSATDYNPTDFEIYKCADGYPNRLTPALYQRWIVADIKDTCLFGSAEGEIESTTVVGRTLNQPTVSNTKQRGFATYNYSVTQKWCLAVNFPWADGSGTDRDKGAGVWDLGDLYTEPYQHGAILTEGVKLINSNAGYNCRPPWLYAGGGGTTASRGGSHFTFSGARWDPYGYWGPAGNNIVWNATQNRCLAFLTFGITDAVPVEPAATSRMVSTAQQYYGVLNFFTAWSPDSSRPYMPVLAERLNASLAVVGEWWIRGRNTGDGSELPNMRHFAVAKNSRIRFKLYETDSSTVEKFPVDYLGFTLSAGHPADASAVIGAPWNYATVKIQVRTKFEPASPRTAIMAQSVVDANQGRRINVAAASLAEVYDLATNPDGNKYWLDTVGKTVWFRHKGGLTYPYDFTNVTTKDFRNYLQQFRQDHIYVILP
ncbi:MAG: hypothetical protein H0W48_00020 [Methylibium sp.]|nr:hypothetical protein [Methylibium sp.]